MVLMNYPVVAAGVAGTIQLLRMSMDFVVSASGSPKDKKGNDNGSSTTQKQKQKPTKAFFEKGPGYGSIAQSEEEEDVDVENNDEKVKEEDRRRTYIRSIFPKISLLLQFSMSIYFGTVGYLNQDAWQIIIAFTILLGAILVFRDMQRERFGSLQRIFQLIAAATVLYSSFHLHHLIASILLALYFILVSFEAYISPYPSTLSQSSGKRLSRRAVMVLLKPYFWPDATSSSAALNRLRAILTWLCVILSKIANLISPILLGWSTTALSRHQYGTAVEYAVLYAIVGFFGSTFREGQSLIYLKVAQAAFVQLSEVAFSHLHSLSLDWHLQKKLGEVLRSMDRGIAACDTLMKYLFLWLVPAIVECLVVCVIFTTYFSYWPLGISVFYFVFVYIVWTIMVTLWRKKFRKAVVQSDNEWHDRCTDSLINFETVKYFTAENYEMKRFSDSVKRYQSGSVNVQASLSFLNISQRLLLQACLATSLSLAARAIQLKMKCCVEEFGCADGNSQCCSDSTCDGMDVGDFVAVLTYTIQLFQPLNFLGSVYNAVVMAVIDLTNLSELLAESPDVVDAPDAIPLPPVNENDPDIAVEFDNVVFHYPSQPSNKGLKGMSFKMKKGTTTAIVGSTGAGKTTVSRLLFRFYDVLGGAVKVNGVDVRTVTQASLRGALGVVPQAASMFNDTLRANILYGKREATQEDLDKAAEQAQLTNFIQSLDDGWETLVGDRGLKLSGGEKQRTAIARCLLKNPPFVLLDEATSALDTITENSVQEALDSLGHERTVLVIAHRLGTIRNADNIIVLQDGVVHEEGTHDELLALNGKYAEMWNMQLNSTKGSSDAIDVLGI